MEEGGRDINFFYSKDMSHNFFKYLSLLQYEGEGGFFEIPLMVVAIANSNQRRIDTTDNPTLYSRTIGKTPCIIYLEQSHR